MFRPEASTHRRGDRGSSRRPAARSSSALAISRASGDIASPKAGGDFSLLPLRRRGKEGGVSVRELAPQVPRDAKNGRLSDAIFSGAFVSPFVGTAALN